MLDYVKLGTEPLRKLRQAAKSPVTPPNVRLPKTKSNMLRGESLFLALAATAAVVKWLRDGAPAAAIDAQKALSIARAGVYEGKMRGKRVVYIREVDDRHANQRDDSFWNGRGCIRFDKGVDQLTVRSWERYFRNQAAFIRRHAATNAD